MAQVLLDSRIMVPVHPGTSIAEYFRKLLVWEFNTTANHQTTLPGPVAPINPGCLSHFS
jgi:hypothetical protein